VAVHDANLQRGTLRAAHVNFTTASVATHTHDTGCSAVWLKLHGAKEVVEITETPLPTRPVTVPTFLINGARNLH